MLEKLHSAYSVMTKGPPASADQMAALLDYFAVVPRDYVELALEATEIEIWHESERYFRIWGPSGCIDMDEGYAIRRRIPDAFPLGDDGGGRILFYASGAGGSGLYCVGYGNLDLNDAIWIAPTLTALLTSASGIELL